MNSTMIRAGIAAGVVAFLVVAVLAIWPVVADAPWEDTTAPVVVDRTDEIRCEAALRLREAVIVASSGQRGYLTLSDEARHQMAEAQREISRHY